MKRAYVWVVRAVARLLRSTGVMGLLDRWAAGSRTGLWVRSWFAIYDLEQMVRLGVPWWTFEAVDEVEAHLAERPGARVFEWGSGVSTCWLAQRSREVHAVEHDPEWAAAMAEHLRGHVQLHLVPPVPSEHPRVPSAKAGHSGLDFAAYVAAIDDVAGDFDLVVVDGRAREACVARAVDRLAPDGLLLLDNVDRQRYRDALSVLGDGVDVRWTRGRTPSLPYPTRTALVRRVVPRDDARR